MLAYRLTGPAGSVTIDGTVSLDGSSETIGTADTVTLPVPETTFSGLRWAETSRDSKNGSFLNLAKKSGARA